MTGAIIQERSSFATALRDARQGRSLSVAETARALLLSDNQIVGLEADDYSAFYGASFAERAARRYAEYLGVDVSLPGGPQGSDTPLAAPEPPTLKPSHLPAFSRRRSRFSAASAARAVLAVGLAALVIGALAWKLRRPVTAAVAPVAVVQEALPVLEAQPPPVESPADDTTPVVAEAAAPVAAPAPAAPAPVAAAPVAAAPAPAAATPAAPSTVPDDFDHRFFLVVTRDVRIQARDAAGTALVSGLQPPNMGRRVVGMPPFSVAVSDEDAVEVYYRGQRIRPGATVYDGIAVTVVR